jgi:DNA-binding CsgD family transcriptional regulator
MFKSTGFELLLEKIGSLSQLEDIDQILDKFINAYGLKNAAYYTNRLPGTSKPLLVTTYSQDWVKRYTSEDYFLTDPVMMALKGSIMPIEWCRLAPVNRWAMKFFGEASEFGVGKHGLTLPVRGLDGDLALLSITSDVSDADWRASKYALMCDFQVIAHAIHAQVRQLSLPRNANANIHLSPRQLQCLQWAARGKTNDDIALILGITERVVRAYVETARFKLNATNKNQAVAKALGLGLIQSEAV